MHEVIPEQLGLRQHWLLPNLRIFKNPLTQNLILAGELGIEGRLVDEDYPTLYPTKQEFYRLKRKRCHPNWSNDSYSKIFLRINVGQKKTSSDNYTKKKFYRICKQVPK